MTNCTESHKIGQLENQTQTNKEQIEDLYRKNEKRRQESIEFDKKFIRVTDQMEEAIHSMNGQTALIEAMHKKVDNIQNELDIVKDDVETIKQNKFNFSMLLDIKRLSLMTICLFFFTIILLLWFAPEVISDFLSTTIKVAK